MAVCHPLAGLLNLYDPHVGPNFGNVSVRRPGIGGSEKLTN
jgi:hypothetical protein